MPKRGNTAEEYEDAFAHSGRTLAVADGASESSFCELWAQSLVRSFVESSPDFPRLGPPGLEAWLEPLQNEWSNRIPWDRLPWYAEEKARDGAYAAFLGLRFSDGNEPAKKAGFWRRLFGRAKPLTARWQAVAVGDCCLFQARGGELVKAFPLTLAEQFTSRPLLLSSRVDQNRQAWSTLQTVEGEFKDGDLFIVATDALAQWILTPDPAGGARWRKLAEMRTEEEFARFVDERRRAGDLRNDDTTLLVCKWKGSNAP
jgi:hypothetical protein